MLIIPVCGPSILYLWHKKRQNRYIFLITIFFAFFHQNQIIAAQSQTALPAGFVEEVIVAGLDTPTGFSVSPDGRIFFTEKAGTIRVFDRGILQSTPFIDLRHEVNTYRDRGMLGIAVHPNFPAQPYIYVAYVYNPPEASGYDWTGARVSRLLRLEADSENLNIALPERTTVLLGTNSTFEHIGSPGQPNTYPYACRAASGGFVRDCLPSDGTTHTVGTVHFGTDGSLYVGNGDGIDFGSENMRAQQIDSLAGKILRIDPLNGNGYPDNPFYDGDPTSNRSKVYALGMRNPFRFTLHPTNGQLWLGDVGNHTWEEVSSGGAGSNFGWPCYEGFMRAATYPSCQARFSGQITVTPPRYAYPHRGGRSAVIGGDIYQGREFPSQYHNAYFFADFNDQAIRYLDRSSGEVGTFATNASGMVQMQDDGKGGLYVLYLISGTFTRIRYVGANNTPPTALLDVDRHSGAEPLTVYFSSARSYDPDGDALRYLWHFGDGTTSSQAEPVHVYDVQGDYTAVLTVTDSKGAARTDRIQIEVGNAPPKARIHNPQVNTRYRIGDRVYFSGAGFDTEDGQLTEDQMSWSVYIHHNEHVHYDYFHMTGEAGTFNYTDHEDNTYLELCLTVTDSGDLSDTTCVDIKAREVTYYFDSVPSGLTLMYAGSRYTTPFSVKTYIRANRIIGAPRSPVDGRLFDHWSDDGDVTHTIKIGPKEKRLVAHYRRVSDKGRQGNPPKSVVAEPTAIPTTTPTAIPTATPTMASTSTHTVTPTAVMKPRPKPTPHPVVIAEEPTRMMVNTPVNTTTPTVTPTPLVTPTPSMTIEATPTMTVASTPSSQPAQGAYEIRSTITPSTNEGQGHILYERWQNIGGDSIDDLLNSVDFPSQPSHQELLTKLEAPAAVGNDYGTRMRGYLHPPVSGDYRFWIAGDDQAQLWLSLDDEVSNKRFIASVSQWTYSREWDRYPEQASALVRLTAGQRYYIEVLHKEADQKDNVAVAWLMPGEASFQERSVIVGEYLSVGSDTLTLSLQE